MQVYRGIVVGALGTVFNISFDWSPQACKGGPNLMVAPCFRRHFNHRVVISLSQNFVSQFTLFPVVAGFVVRIRFVVRLVLLQPIDDVAFFFLRAWFGYCPICFLYLSVFEHVEQSIQSFCSASVQNDTANWSIQSVHRTNECLARFAVFHADIFFYHLTQRRVARYVALYNI